MALRMTAGAVATIAILIALNRIFSKDSPCHSRISNPAQYAATKAPYFWSDDLHFNHTVRSTVKVPREYTPPGCVAESIWIMARHGTRNPGSEIMAKLVTKSKKLQTEILRGHEISYEPRGSLCTAELEALKDWQPHPNCLDDTKEKWLVTQGEDELFGIGTRFRERYPHLFSREYNPKVHNFKFTKTQRAEASARAFSRGALGLEQSLRIQYPEALRADPVLRFYKACPRWKEEVDKNPATYREQKNFEASAVFKAMLTKLTARLGLQRPLSVADAETMYLTCSFETAWTPRIPSPWCAVLDEEDFSILEYHQDLEYYWVDGYGHELTYNQACGPVSDVIRQFRSKQSNSSSHDVTAYFTHSGTLLKFISHLGLFKDNSPLTSESFHHHRMQRKWRTSFIDKFATNIAFVLYRCADEGSATTYNVGLLFQEDPLEAPHCNGKWVCPLDEFESFFKNSVHDCEQNVQTMCKSRGKVLVQEKDDSPRLRS